MRNLYLRQFYEKVADMANQAIANDVEPFALSICLQNLVVQLDREARKREAAEAEEANKKEEKTDD